MKIILSLMMLCIAVTGYAGQSNSSRSYGQNQSAGPAAVPQTVPFAEPSTIAAPATVEKQRKTSVFKSVRQALSVKKQIRKIKDVRENQDAPIDPFAIVGFVFGVLALGLFLTIIFPFFTGLIAVIFSAIGLSRTSKGEYSGKGFAIAGLILGIVVILLFWLLVMLLAALVI